MKQGKKRTLTESRRMTKFRLKAFNLDEFQSQLEAEGWMSDAEWKKFGIRQ